MNVMAMDRLEELRSAAVRQFEKLGYPTTRDEDWRYTNVAPIARTRFSPAAPVEALPADRLERFVLPELKGTQLVFVNGRYAPELSALAMLPHGVLVGSLGDALRLDPGCVHLFLGRLASFEEHAFTALNTAHFQDGAFVYVPGGLVLEEPIHVAHLTVPQAEPSMTSPRNVIVLQRGSRATVIESYAGLEGKPCFTNAVTEILQMDGSILDHIKVQRESSATYHIARTEVQQERDSHLRSVSISIGGLLVRNDLATTLDAPGVGCALDGLYLASGRQHVDNHTSIDHARPHGSSQELYKGILSGRASAVFNGKVIVRKDAQKTDAHQTNKNLLLSETALIDTKPQLEIFADDVRCTHGATIGQLDKDAVFYLRSRGVDLHSARGLLVYAFVSEVLDRVPVAGLRAQLEAEVLEWLEKSQGDMP
jgi:Fe-S cluster assembly protein SufD